MLTYIRQQTGKRMLSGQTDFKDTEWIVENTGKEPAILALDFMHVPKQMGHQVGDTKVAIDWHRKRGGIVAYQWHWVSPVGAHDLGSGFYTKSSDFDLAAVLKEPGGTAYQALLSDIDDVAAELKALSDAGVPVLFRPLHEAQGGWFWWGAKGAASCIALYKLIFARITGYHRIHNVAWVWNAYPASDGKGDPAEWYPGDDYVDVIASDYLSSAQNFRDLDQLGHGKKIVAIAETMNPPDPAKCFAEGANWAYWVAWARRDWNKSSAQDMKNAMASSLTTDLSSLHL